MNGSYQRYEWESGEGGMGREWPTKLQVGEISSGVFFLFFSLFLLHSKMIIVKNAYFKIARR